MNTFMTPLKSTDEACYTQGPGRSLRGLILPSVQGYEEGSTIARQVFDLPNINGPR